MDRMKWTSFLPILISLLTVEQVCGSCDPMNPCPPPFLDFMVFFAETLNNFPDLLQNRSSLSTECPENVNWTDFNWRLETGNPVPLDPVCSVSTSPYPPPATSPSNSPATNQPNTPEISRTSFGVSIATKPSDSSPSILSTTPGSTQPPPIQSDVKDSGARDIGLPVGVAIGAALLLMIIVIVAVVCVRRHRDPKQSIFGRGLSTSSQSPLVASLDMPDTPQAQQTVVILSDSTFQESSTDATIRRPTTGNGVVNIVLTEKKFPDEMEAEGNAGGLDNKAFAVVEEELEEDPGYAGSEACQENWENEWNNKFEEVLMESNDDLPKDAEGETSFDSSHKQKLSSRTSSSSSKTLPYSLTKKTSSPLGSPSTRKSQVLDFRMPSSSTRSAAFSAGNNSVLAKPQTSQFSRPSPYNWPTSGVDMLVGRPTSPKAALEKRSPSTISEAPPAYSSPIVKPNEEDPMLFRQRKPSFEHPATPSTPSGLPTYTEVMATRDTQSTSPQRKQGPPPPSKQLSSTGAPTPASRSPSTPPNSHLVKGSPGKNPDKGSSKTNGVSPEKPSNTAVVRPWTAGKGQATDNGQEAVQSTPITASTNDPSATEVTPSDSVGEYSFRPVRSLLSQFETLDRKKP